MVEVCTTKISACISGNDKITFPFNAPPGASPCPGANPGPSPGPGALPRKVDWGVTWWRWLLVVLNILTLKLRKPHPLLMVQGLLLATVRGVISGEGGDVGEGGDKWRGKEGGEGGERGGREGGREGGGGEGVGWGLDVCVRGGG